MIMMMMNLYNPATKYLEGDVDNNNSLNVEEYDHEDDNINCKNDLIISRIKNESIKKHARKSLSDKEFNFDNISVAKPNAVLANFLSNCDSDKFCLNYFKNFQNKELFKRIKSFVKIMITLIEFNEKSLKLK